MDEHAAFPWCFLESSLSCDFKKLKTLEQLCNSISPFISFTPKLATVAFFTDRWERSWSRGLIRDNSIVQGNLLDWGGYGGGCRCGRSFSTSWNREIWNWLTQRFDNVMRLLDYAAVMLVRNCPELDSVKVFCLSALVRSCALELCWVGLSNSINADQ